MKYLALLALLAGCMVGPDHSVPEVALPESYEQAHITQEEPIDLATWWTQFGDPFLEELVDEALCCNFDFLIALRKIEEMRAQFKIEKSALYPQIAGDAAAIRSRQSENLVSEVIEDPVTFTSATDTNFAGPLIQNFFQIGLDATWELDFWGKNRRRAEFGLQQYQASQESALNVRISLVAEVSRAYVVIRSLQKQVSISKEQIGRQKELLQLVRSLYEAGLVSHGDVARAQAELEREEGNLPLFERELKASIFTLAQALGRPPEGMVARFSETAPIPVGALPEAMPSELLRRRPDIRQAERELAAATSRIGIAKAEFFPSFSLLGNFGVQSNDKDLLFVWPSRFWTIGPSMVWNLFTGGRLIGQLQVETERQKQAVFFYEKAINDSLVDVEVALVGYFKQKERVQNLNERIESNLLIRAYALDQYLAGLIPIFEVIEAEKELFRNQLLEVAAAETETTFLISLYKALGGGWECSE
ncbi:MAG: Outer membrane protein OprM [Chlamydiae bacterium]|nr:Outer membrane protein OprM [Chlamydiota bacterium]